ncbi:MAG: (Fe-S)-binding protein [Phycisphaerae bacterium]
MKVSLFVTCLTDLFAPDVGMAVVKTLEYFGCTVDFPTAQTCCGQPSYNNGFPADARALAARMIEVFHDADYVVTPSGSCCAMIRDHYVELFQDDPAQRKLAEDFVARCYEYVEFLTKILKVDLTGLTLPKEEKFTYHYTCHLRGLGLSGEPSIRLLKQLGGAQFTKLEKAEQCCGFGGTFAIKYPDISGAMVRDKVDCGCKTGADTMIVNDGGCAMNIGGAGHRTHAPFRVRHIAQIIAAAIEHTAEVKRP